METIVWVIIALVAIYLTSVANAKKQAKRGEGESSAGDRRAHGEAWPSLEKPKSLKELMEQFSKAATNAENPASRPSPSEQAARRTATASVQSAAQPAERMTSSMRTLGESRGMQTAEAIRGQETILRGEETVLHSRDTVLHSGEKLSGSRLEPMPGSGESGSNDRDVLLDSQETIDLSPLLSLETEEGFAAAASRHSRRKDAAATAQERALHGKGTQDGRHDAHYGAPEYPEHSEHESIAEIVGDFDLRTAMIYAEILKPKFSE